MLAGLGDNNNGAMLVVDDPDDLYQDAAGRAPSSNMNGAAAVPTVQTTPTTMMTNNEGDCSSQASLPSSAPFSLSAPVSAAPSTADLHAQDLDHLEGDGNLHRAVQDSQKEGSKSCSSDGMENGEVDDPTDEPSSKRSRHQE